MAKAQKERFIPGVIIGSLPENLREKREVILAEKGSSVPGCGSSIFEGMRKHVLWGGWSMGK